MNDVDIVTTPETENSPLVSTIGSQGVHEFIRYFLASAGALLVDIGMLALLTSMLGVPYLYSGAIAFLLGLVIVYILSITWVFDHRQIHAPVVEFLIFTVIGIVGLGLNELVLWLLTGIFGVYYLASKIASVVVVFSWNFTARKMALFR